MSDQIAVKKKAPVPIPYFKKADAAAIQALERGNASEAQQKRALAWIVNSACLTYDFCDKPESERLAAVFDGRRFAGLQIVKLLKVNLAALSEEK
jgi:hypothetical protein